MNIKKLRGKMIEKGITQKELGERLKKNPTTVSRWLNGAKMPVDIIPEIMDCLSLTDDEGVKIFLR